MFRMRCLVLFCLLPAAVFAQAPVDYNDVGVIINVNDSNSVAIGEYFVAQRQVPLRNVIRIDAPAKETITPEEFADVRGQIEDYLTSTGLVDTLNYLVTTKGVPLRVNYGGTLIQPDTRNASFDAEIMLILGYFSSHIGRYTLLIPPGSVRTHAYFMKDEPYDRRAMIPGTSPPQPFDMFLTTRLTGLTREDVFALIDRSGPFTLVDRDSALFVFDRDPRPIQLNPYDSNLALAGSMLAAQGWNTLVNHDSIYVTGQRNVLGYASWGSNDHYDHHYTTKARPMNHWLPGSIAETYVSTSARNFTPGQEGGQSRIADLIAEGCTGASGYVFEPYSIALTWVNVLYERYTRGYNLAESFYMTNPTISWMATVVGDPKTSIITAYPPVPAPVVDAPAEVCTDEAFTLTVDTVLAGRAHWFAGDEATVKGEGPPYDDTHPLWIASGPTCTTVSQESGSRSWTFVNENFVGRGFGTATVTVREGMEAAITASADTVFLGGDPDVQFSVTADGAVSWAWDFGDGTTSSDPAPLHRYTRAGTFAVSVEVSNGTCSTKAGTTIVVRDGTTDVEDTPAVARIALLQSYPNPAAPVTAVPFRLPARAHVRLTITDVLGRPVATLVNTAMDAGTHTVLWESAALPNGMYHCVLEAGKQRVSRRITVAR